MERVNVEFLFGNLLDLTWQHVVMWCIGGLLIYLAIAKDMEPTLLLPIGFGTLLVNIPNVDLIQEGG
uniref:sodium ion-translocating decarboxylase subunit beta n=1 Tax=Gemmiger formicilis TaxID=745368 RepID=UPI003FEFC2C9